METATAKTVFPINRKDEKLNAILNTGKKEVLDEFEKVCPTPMSFQAIKKDIHDIFDEIARQLRDK